MRPYRSLRPAPFELTAIGSLPHREAGEAVRFVLEHLPVIPHWPQLPQRSPLEDMVHQFLEGMPGLREDPQGLWVETEGGEWEAFYEAVESRDLSRFAMSPERAKGFYAFLELLPRPAPPFLKGQVTGPVTLGFCLKDSKGRYAFYDDQIHHALVELLKAKARWQVDRFKEVHPEGTPILFFDEPALAGYGTPQMSFSKERALETFRELKEGLEALVGIHVCANTDWPMVLEAGFDIVSLDAYDYSDSFLLWLDPLGEFLEKGGIVAWGVVPTRREALSAEDALGVVKRLEGIWERLLREGIREEFLRQALITPSCGTGTLAVEEAERVYRLLKEVRGLWSF